MFGAFFHLKVSDRQGLNSESCVWRAVSAHSSHHPQNALFSIYVHKGGLKPLSFHFNFLKVETSNFIKKAAIKHLPHRSYFYIST